MSKFLRTSIFLLLALSLTSCSMMAIGYNNADWYLRYKINNYTSFNPAQKEKNPARSRCFHELAPP